MSSRRVCVIAAPRAAGPGVSIIIASFRRFRNVLPANPPSMLTTGVCDRTMPTLYSDDADCQAVANSIDECATGLRGLITSQVEHIKATLAREASEKRALLVDVYRTCGRRCLWVTAYGVLARAMLGAG